MKIYTLNTPAEQRGGEAGMLAMQDQQLANKFSLSNKGMHRRPWKYTSKDHGGQHPLQNIHTHTHFELWCVKAKSLDSHKHRQTSTFGTTDKSTGDQWKIIPAM